MAEAVDRIGSPARTAFQAGDRLFQRLLAAMAGTVLVIMGAMLIALTISAWPAIRLFGLAFFITSTWDPVAGEFGALP
ncbi:MAG: phosphate ABC transporter permease subunit PstC, partial [Armatimonadota bacterium]